jgi:multidrug transporter EmrE-like cation transporter
VIGWVFICLSVCANIGLNLSLRQTALGVDTSSIRSTVTTLLGNGWLWFGGICGVALVASYMAAIRNLPLSMAYVSVTSLAMVGLAVEGAASGRESIGFGQVAGVVLVLLGVLSIALSQGRT